MDIYNVRDMPKNHLLKYEIQLLHKIIKFHIPSIFKISNDATITTHMDYQPTLEINDPEFEIISSHLNKQ